MTHPIATYELDEDALLDATITEVAEARAHLNDAEAVIAARLERRASGEDQVAVEGITEHHVERAKSCLVVAAGRLARDEVGLSETYPMAAEAIFACDAAIAHVRIFENRNRDGLRDAGTSSHAEKSIDAARRATHTLLADLLEDRAKKS